MCLTYPDDAAQFIEEQVVVPTCVQALFYVAVQLVHNALHVRVLVLEHRENTSEAWLKDSQSVYDFALAHNKACCFCTLRLWLCAA